MYIYSLACNKDKPYKNVSEPRIKRKSQSHLIFVQFLKQTLTISGILSERLFDCRTPRYSREFPGITKVHFFVWECLENFSGISRENVFVFNWPHIAQELPRILGNFLSTHFQALRASENSRELSGTVIASNKYRESTGTVGNSRDISKSREFPSFVSYG